MSEVCPDCGMEMEPPEGHHLVGCLPRDGGKNPMLPPDHLFGAWPKGESEICFLCGRHMEVPPGMDFISCDYGLHTFKPIEKEEGQMEEMTEDGVRAIAREEAAKAAGEVRAHVDSFNIANQLEEYTKWLMEEDLKLISLAGNPIQITTQEWNVRLKDLLRAKKQMTDELSAIVERAEKAAAELKGAIPPGPPAEAGS